MTHVDIPEEIGRFGREIETAIYRIVQESLGNVHRHSSSLVAYVRLARRGNKAFLEVEDHGKGMAGAPDTRTETAAAPPGIGVAAMSERVKQLGGQFSISTELGKGTTIRVILPAGAPAALRAAAASGSAG
jgi:two-component system NarL family sensor kinase